MANVPNTTKKRAQQKRTKIQKQKNSDNRRREKHLYMQNRVTDGVPSSPFVRVTKHGYPWVERSELRVSGPVVGLASVQEVLARFRDDNLHLRVAWRQSYITVQDTYKTHKKQESRSSLGFLFDKGWVLH